MTAFDDPRARKIAEYRRKAIEAAAQAAATKDEFVRYTWELVASGYEDLADRLERDARNK